jgi:hypothetical protein
MCRSVLRSRLHSTSTSLGQILGIEKRDHILRLDDRQVAASHRPGVGCSFLAVEQRDLAKQLDVRIR